MRLHDGAERFHVTNPLAVAVPVEDGRPWLLDMATSAIPYNRVLLYRSLGMALPAATASDAAFFQRAKFARCAPGTASDAPLKTRARPIS